MVSIRPIILVALLSLFCSQAQAITWDLTDQDCDAFDLNWSSSGAGVSLVTEDTRTAYKMTGNTDVIVNSSLTWTHGMTLEVVFKMVWSTTISGSDFNGFFLDARDSARFNYNVELGADPSFIAADHSPMLISRTISAGPVGNWLRAKSHYQQNTWHTLRMVVKDDYLYVWIDGYLYCCKHGPSTALASGANTVFFDAFKQGVGSSLELYIDSIKMSSTPEAPAAPGGIRIQGASVASRMAQPSQPDASYLPVQALRYYKPDLAIGAATFELPTVDTSDAFASKVRIYNGSAKKSLLINPSF